MPQTEKIYLGGLKNVSNGLVYLHAFSQTDQLKKNHAIKCHRDVSISKKANKNRLKPMTILQNQITPIRNSEPKSNELAYGLTSERIRTWWPKNTSQVKCGPNEDGLQLILSKKCSGGVSPENAPENYEDKKS